MVHDDEGWVSFRGRRWVLLAAGFMTTMSAFSAGFVDSGFCHHSHGWYFTCRYPRLSVCIQLSSLQLIPWMTLVCRFKKTTSAPTRTGTGCQQRPVPPWVCFRHSLLVSCSVHSQSPSGLELPRILTSPNEPGHFRCVDAAAPPERQGSISHDRPSRRPFPGH
jgi:hypothetical protein